MLSQIWMQLYTMFIIWRTILDRILENKNNRGCISGTIESNNWHTYPLYQRMSGDIRQFNFDLVCDVIVNLNAIKGKCP